MDTKTNKKPPPAHASNGCEDTPQLLDQSAVTTPPLSDVYGSRAPTGTPIYGSDTAVMAYKHVFTPEKIVPILFKVT
ncbi:MAG: hypothetical protein JXM69_19940 [Anaerolineae bacterium]|nr:hypothetical protein [Anaerolineae bacterium]